MEQPDVYGMCEEYQYMNSEGWKYTFYQTSQGSCNICVAFQLSNIYCTRQQQYYNLIYKKHVTPKEFVNKYEKISVKRLRVYTHA